MSVTQDQELLRRISPELLGSALRFPALYRVYQESYAERPPAEALRERQTARLSRLLREVLTDVPALRAHGLDRSTEPFQLLAALPTMSKADIVADLAAHVSDRLQPTACVAVTTSGTTGVPLRIIHTHEHLIQSGAAELARQLRYGLPFDRKTLQPFKLGGAAWTEYTVVNTGFTRVAEFGFLTDATATERADVARRCVAFGPDAVFSHPSRIADLVDLLRDGGVASLPVRVVRTFGETLTPPVRTLIEAFFETTVRDQYALNEVSTVAAECTSGRMHIDADRLWVELLAPDGSPAPAGMPGEVTVTNFFNTAMPFVRYRTGDIAAWSTDSCDCGDPAPVLGLIAGRDPGRITFPDGTAIDALRVVRALEHAPLSKVQVVQNETGLVVLAVPLPAERRIDWQSDTAAKVHAVVGDRLQVTVREAADSDFRRSGNREKTPAFVSLLAPSNGRR
ncbi:hypothetical protein OG474_23810 [Kribbella sp. NBC_01505]|uniref:phenylacetate--CoA ligase family protein n=1 Tax=Kribbella sp. NBC_01505 TaxID=2903580 RepID=UPI0038688DD3